MVGLPSASGSTFDPLVEMSLSRVPFGEIPEANARLLYEPRLAPGFIFTCNVMVPEAPTTSASAPVRRVFIEVPLNPEFLVKPLDEIETTSTNLLPNTPIKSSST